MIKRKRTLKYYFSVEGETDHMKKNMPKALCCRHENESKSVMRMSIQLD